MFLFRDSSRWGRARAGTGALARLGPDIFSAVQEQVGLKLESAEAPVRFLVIDHVERPSAN